jgi:hypothetical protein
MARESKREDGKKMVGTVLVPTDFSDNGKKIILCLTKIPGINEVVLQHVVNATQYPNAGGHTNRISGMRRSSSVRKKSSLRVLDLP